MVVKMEPLTERKETYMTSSRHLLIPAVAALSVASLGGLALAQHSMSHSTVKPDVRVVKNAKLGKILVNSKGLTLYHLVKENTGAIHCTGSCLSLWPALKLPKGQQRPTHGKGVVDKLGFIVRKGVGDQITYDGWPLYTFAGDKKPGQAKGQDFAKVWFVVAPAPKVTFKVSITPNGSSTWGAVKLTYSYRHKKYSASCSKQSCAIRVHAGVGVHLSETPADSATWPFNGWKATPVDGGTTITTNGGQPALKLESNDSYDITAAYVPGGGGY